MSKFQRIGESLGNFKLLGNYSELGSEFENIAANLIDQWRILNLYVPNSFSGRVAWTYPSERVKYDLPKPTIGRKPFIGLNVTLGIPMTMPYYAYWLDEYLYFGIGLSPKLGLDISWPISDKFAIGFYTNIGLNVSFSYRGGFNVKVGALILVGDINNRPFIFGLAPCTGFNVINYQGFLPLEFRFGRVLSKRFYITGNLNMGIPVGGSFMIEPGIALGWRLGKY